MADTRKRTMIAVAIAGFALGGGIAIVRSSPSSTVEELPAPTEPVRTTVAPAPEVAPIVPAVGEPFVQVTDPRLLARWDADARSPLSLSSVLARLDANAPSIAAGTATTGALLARQSASWTAIAKTLDDDVARIVAELGIDWETDIAKTYDRSAAKTAEGRDAAHRGNGNVARVLDTRWTTSERSRWLLAAVVYRPDRRDFVPGTCGELRLVYRLAYEAAVDRRTFASRLPFTVNAVFHVPEDDADCQRVAVGWRMPAVDDANVDAVAGRLLDGPLALDRLRLAQLELDAQIVRFPSDLERVEARGFAGQALYWMRIFAKRGDTVVPIGLENTPDVQAIRADATKRAALLKWIGDSLLAIDTGVFQLPEALQAKVALSWSTLGSARPANRPFSAIVSPTEIDALARGVADGVETFVTGGATLLERLDGASCSGCHQSSSTAGFHMLGIDREYGTDRAAVHAATDGNRLQLAFSPHFAAEQPRRLAYLEALALGRAPERMRPHPSAPAAQWSPFGPSYARAQVDQPCVIGNELPDATRWQCAEGTSCRVLAQDSAGGFQLGQCVPDEPIAGVSCRTATVESANDPDAELFAWNVRAFEDRVAHEDDLYAISTGDLNAHAYNCRPAKIGVPLGRVSRNCRPDERMLAPFDGASPPEICAIVGGKGFEQMAMGAFDSLAFAAGVGRGLLDTCNATRPCREDYICQALPDFLAQPHGVVEPALLTSIQARGLGFCTPTYFVYQLRLDGHPSPV
ncbi:MAG TPA: hypothetical protein VG755_38860 [Nannocystaceae bacterium]|nr:hypothetical protein [Nannocystaceae bacterium]